MKHCSLFWPFTVILMLAGCAPQSTPFIASTKSSVELRAMQGRVVPGDSNTVMRSVIATLQDLGYRVTKADADAGTVSGTRGAILRLAVIVRPSGSHDSIIRANAVVIMPGKEVQVDDPRFYLADFFAPFEATSGRQLTGISQSLSIPDSVMPTAEKNLPKDQAATSVKK